MSQNRRYVILGLLSAVAFLVAVLAVGYFRDDALAQEAGAPRVGPPTMLAATGACGLGGEVSVLYVIDSEKKQMAVYGAFGGQKIELVAARRIFYDLELPEFNDVSAGPFRVPNLKKAFEKATEKKEGAKEEPPRRR
jgi:hypothetical protein